MEKHFVGKTTFLKEECQSSGARPSSEGARVQTPRLNCLPLSPWGWGLGGRASPCLSPWPFQTRWATSGGAGHRQVVSQPHQRFCLENFID